MSNTWWLVCCVLVGTYLGVCFCAINGHLPEANGYSLCGAIAGLTFGIAGDIFSQAGP